VPFNGHIHVENSATGMLSESLSWPKHAGVPPPRVVGPKVFTPGQLMRTMNIPDFFKGAPAHPGYQESHMQYAEMRNYFAQLILVQ
jgi:hypothetical protein